MQKFIISVKEKTTGRDVISPILSILSMVLVIILSEFLCWVLLLLWIRLKKKIILLNLKLKVMKSSNIWKIVIGAVSAALGYILNAIGL